jgi:hypothetical protein
MEDIHGVIIQNIDDIDTIANYCSQNKELQKKCLTRRFWKPFFEKHGLELPAKIKSLEYIIDLYKREKAKQLKNEFNLKNDFTMELVYLKPREQSKENVIRLLNDCKINNNIDEYEYIEDINIDTDNMLIVFTMKNKYSKNNYVYFTEMIDATREQLDCFLFHLFYNDMVTIESY